MFQYGVNLTEGKTRLVRWSGDIERMIHGFIQSFDRNILRKEGACGSVVGWGTMLQAGRWRVRFLMKSLDFSIYFILPAAL
jgi:hypothetical protein